MGFLQNQLAGIDRRGDFHCSRIFLNDGFDRLGIAILRAPIELLPIKKPFLHLFASIAWGRSMRYELGFCVSARLDRKSTRLNSSHQIISYAVFCLKKKKAWWF